MPDARDPQVPQARAARAGRSVTAPVAVRTTVWRAVVAACGFVGVGLAPGSLAYLSQLSSLLVGVYFAALALVPVATAGRRVDEPDPWLRMSVSVLTSITGIVYGTLLAASYGPTYSLFEHLLTPIVVAADFGFAGRNQVNIRWWHVATLPAGGLAYLAFALHRREPLYPFLDTDSGAFVPTIIGTFVGVLVAGVLMLGIGRVKARRVAVAAGPAR